MPLTVYRSDDASAPSLTGEIGSMITVLDAILVNGYGSKAAAGWTKAYSGTNLAAYRMSTVSPATGMYLRVDDTGTSTARVVGYTSMSDVDTGTNPFPTSSQFSGGLYLRKSTTTDGTVRPWLAIACERGFYFFTYSAQTSFGSNSVDDGAFYFGDFTSYRAVDNKNCLIHSNHTASGSGGNGNIFPGINGSYTTGHYIYLASDYLNVFGSKIASKMKRGITNLSGDSNYIGIAISNAFPDPVTGNLTLFGLDLVENSTNASRGIFPGLYEPYGGTNVGSTYDTFTGSGTLNGIDFILLPVYYTSTIARVAIQTSGSWYS